MDIEERIAELEEADPADAAGIADQLARLITELLDSGEEIVA